jgi:hypothetical protein
VKSQPTNADVAKRFTDALPNIGETANPGALSPAGKALLKAKRLAEEERQRAEFGKHLTFPPGQKGG